MEELRYPLHHEVYIFRYSEEHGLDPFVVMGLIRAESSFRQDAVSPVGARGLMQIMPETAAWLAEPGRLDIDGHSADRLFDPAYNIRMGTFYLNMLLEMFTVPDTAFAAYNAGMGNVSRWLENPAYSDDGINLHTIPFPETRNYVERVNQFAETYRKLYGDLHG